MRAKLLYFTAKRPSKAAKRTQQATVAARARITGVDYQTGADGIETGEVKISDRQGVGDHNQHQVSDLLQAIAEVGKV